MQIEYEAMFPSVDKDEWPFLDAKRLYRAYMNKEDQKMIYFVRHAESEANVVDDRFQDSHSPLSEEGKRQAEVLAERISRIGIDGIVSSPFKRAHQTAEAIAHKTGKSITYSDLLEEAKVPSMYYGKRRDDPEIVRLQEIYKQHRLEENWRLADEENFTDRKTRGKKSFHFCKTARKTICSL